MSETLDSASARRQLLFAALAHQDALALLRARCPTPTPVEQFFEHLAVDRADITGLLGPLPEGPDLIDVVERFFVDVQSEACRWLQPSPQGPRVWPWPADEPAAELPDAAALAQLSAISRQLLGELDLKRLLPFLISRTVALTGARAAALWLADPTNDALECVEQRGWSSLSSVPLSPAQRLALLTREPSSFEAGPGEDDLAALLGHLGETRALVGTLRFQNELLGLLVLSVDGRPHWLPLLADLTVVALRNAAHYREVLQRAVALSQANVHLQSLDRMKDQFLATVSHELRTPLNIISGFGAILLDEEEAGALSEPQRHYLGKMLEGARQLNDMVSDLLDYSRIQAGKLRLERRPLAIVPLLKELADTFAPLAASSGHTLELVSEGEDWRVHADPSRVQQVVANLLTNAIKFTLPGGTIVLAARVEGDDVAVSVEDDGMGIRSEQRGQLFQHFSQMDSGYTRRFGGTGLGLAIARSLVEAHGGHIDVVSPPPNKLKGSRFWFTLPRL